MPAGERQPEPRPAQLPCPDRKVTVVLDDLRSYVQMASGITEATTAKARDVITGLLATGLSLTSRAVPAPDVVGSVQELADELVATSRSNRELLTGVIRSEVDKAVGRMGFVREDELAALRRHVQRLESEVHELKTAAASGSAPVTQESGAQAGAEQAAGSPAGTPADKPKKKKVIVEPEAGA